MPEPKDDFEVSMFLTDSSTRHQLLTKTKEFTTSKGKGTLEDWLGPGEAAKGDAVATSIGKEGDREVIVIREESPDDEFVLANIPSAPLSAAENGSEVDETMVPQVSARAGADDKKLAPRTTYDGFSIYGRVLCLVVKRRGGAATAAAAKHLSSQKMMENWVSTQAAREEPDGA